METRPSQAKASLHASSFPFRLLTFDFRLVLLPCALPHPDHDDPASQLLGWLLACRCDGHPRVADGDSSPVDLPPSRDALGGSVHLTACRDYDGAAGISVEGGSPEHTCSSRVGRFGVCNSYRQRSPLRDNDRSFERG